MSEQPTAEWLASRAKDGRYRIAAHIRLDGWHRTGWYVYDIDDPEGKHLTRYTSREKALAHADRLNRREVPS